MAGASLGGRDSPRHSPKWKEKKKKKKEAAAAEKEARADERGGERGGGAGETAGGGSMPLGGRTLPLCLAGAAPALSGHRASSLPPQPLCLPASAAAPETSATGPWSS